MFNKSKIILIGVAIAVVIAVLSIILANLPKPTPAPSPTGQLQPQPSANTKPAVLYDSQGSDKLLNTVKDRPALTTSDLAVRAKLIASLGNKSGILIKTNTYILEYVKAPNAFQVEIVTTNINTAKTQAVQWLQSQGLSLEGICKLPVMFYLNREISNQLREQEIKFDPLPEGC